MDNIVEEADLHNSHPWFKASWTNNRFYASFAPNHSDDRSEASSNSGTNMSASGEEATLPEYEIDSNGALCTWTITIRGRDGSSNVTLTMNPSVLMQNALDIYCAATTLRCALTQGIALMIDSGTRLQSIDLGKLLIKHNCVAYNT